MNDTDTNTDPATPKPAAGVATDTGTAAEQRIAHLFRHSLRAGRIHPLQHLVREWRRTTARTAAR